MRRPPRVGVVAPRVGAGLDSYEPVDACIVGKAAARAGEVRIERRRMRVDRIDVPACGIRLPDLDQRVAHGPPVAVQHATGEDDSLAERFAPMLPREVRVPWRDRYAPERGTAALVEPFIGQSHQLVARRAHLGRAIVGKEIRRLEVEICHAAATGGSGRAGTSITRSLDDESRARLPPGKFIPGADLKSAYTLDSTCGVMAVRGDG